MSIIYRFLVEWYFAFFQVREAFTLPFDSYYYLILVLILIIIIILIL